MNITEPIWRNCAAYPEVPALVFEGTTVSYRALWRTVAIVSTRLVAAGIAKGDVVAVGLKSPAAFLVAVLCLARIGAAGTPYRPEWPDALKKELLGRNGAKAVIRDNIDTWVAGDALSLSYLTSLALFGGDTSGIQDAAPMADDVADAWWWIALSSGTTGTPKSIPQTHRRGSLASVLLGRAGRPDMKRLLIFTDMAITMGLGAALRCLYQGSTLILTQQASGRTFFELAAKDRPTRVVISTGLAAKLLQFAEANSVKAGACASILSIQVGGSAVSPALCQGIERHVCANIDVAYGATESGGLALIDNEIRKLRPESHGRLYPWVRAEAVDDQGQALAAGQHGLLRFNTPLLVADGYIDNEVATAKAFKNGWYYPGDRGAVDEAGFVYLSGRADELLNLGGLKLNPETIESVLNAHPSVFESAVVALAVGEAGVPVLVAAVVPRGNLDLGELRALCSQHLAQSSIPRKFVLVESLPKNVGGKLMRHELQAMLRLVRSPTAEPPLQLG